MHEILIDRIIELKEMIQKQTIQIDELITTQYKFEFGTRDYHSLAKRISAVNKEKRSLEELLFINETLAGTSKKGMLQ